MSRHRPVKIFAILAATAITVGGAVAIASPAEAATGPAECPAVPAPGHATCFSIFLPVPKKASAGYAAPAMGESDPSQPHTPAQLRGAYEVPTSTTTATVAIVDAGDTPTVESDLGQYRSAYGLGECDTSNDCLSIVNQDGVTSPLPSAASAAWAQEADLDTQMVSAICPTCHILLVEADSSLLTDLNAGALTAASLGAKYISMSWGASETSNEATVGTSALSSAGVDYVAAAGDHGFATSWPAADPNVVSVGGTTLLPDSSGSRGWQDEVWNSQVPGTPSATAAGCSLYETQPAWQQAITSIATAGCDNRALNDVSIDGDPYTGAYVYVNGALALAGGTSMGAPMIAAMYAIAGAPNGTPAAYFPYANATASNVADVTTGNDNITGDCASLLCDAGIGYDGPSGLGVPLGVSLFAPASEPSGSTTITFTAHATVSDQAGSAVSVDSVSATDSDSSKTVTYTATGLPTGVSMSSAGTFSGTPTTAGDYTVTVTAADGTGTTASTSFAWAVTAAPPAGGGGGGGSSTPPPSGGGTSGGNGGNLNPTPAPVTVAPVPAQAPSTGKPVTVQVHATAAPGETLAFTATGLPPGLSIGLDTGLITGTPTTPGSYHTVVTITADSTDLVPALIGAAPAVEPADSVPTIVTINWVIGGKAITGTMSADHAPTIEGSMIRGHKIHVTAIEWTDADTDKALSPTVTCTWFANGKQVFKTSYCTVRVPRSSHYAGQRLTVMLTAKADGYAAYAATSPARVIRPSQLAPSVTPHINGVRVTGGRVHLAGIGWHLDAAHGSTVHPQVRCEWYVRGRMISDGPCSVTIPGSRRYAGAYIRVKVIASAKGYATYTAMSPVRVIRR